MRRDGRESRSRFCCCCCVDGTSSFCCWCCCCCGVKLSSSSSFWTDRRWWSGDRDGCCYWLSTSTGRWRSDLNFALLSLAVEAVAGTFDSFGTWSDAITTSIVDCPAKVIYFLNIFHISDNYFFIIISKNQLTQSSAEFFEEDEVAFWIADSAMWAMWRFNTVRLLLSMREVVVLLGAATTSAFIPIWKKPTNLFYLPLTNKTKIVLDFRIPHAGVQQLSLGVVDRAETQETVGVLSRPVCITSLTVSRAGEQLFETLLSFRRVREGGDSLTPRFSLALFYTRYPSRCVCVCV